MNRSKVGQIRSILEKVLNENEELKSLGVSISLGNARFDDKSVKFHSFMVIDKDDSGKVMSKEALDFERYCWKFGLKKEHLHETFRCNGKMYEIVGLKPLSTKYPIICRSITDGKDYKFPVYVVESALKAKEKENAGK